MEVFSIRPCFIGMDTITQNHPAILPQRGNKLRNKYGYCGDFSPVGYQLPEKPRTLFRRFWAWFGW